MNRFPFLLTVLTLYIGTINAQEPVTRDRADSDVISFERHFLHSGTDSHAVAVPYRIRHDFFVFTRSLANQSETYTAKADVIVEILDSTGNSIARKIDNISLSAATNSMIELRKNFVQGLMSFRLPSGRYTVLIRAEDLESKRISPNIERPLVIPYRPSFAQSSFIPVQNHQATAGSYTLCNLGGDVSFSHDFGFLFTVSSPLPLQAKVSIVQIAGDDNDERLPILDSVMLLSPVTGSLAGFLLQHNEITLTSVPTPASGIILLPVKGSEFRQGRYELVLSFGDSIKENIPFDVRWLDMPLSLNDLEIATLPLQYLLLEKEYSTLRRGSRESRITKFDDFWKKKDPTPATAYNELMAEFYRRVDYAISAYRTLKEPNGSLTDRGKIYILYGKPTTTERTLIPGSSPKEIWKYDNLKKTFIFEDPSKQGNYKLAKSK